ncbi:hypothetical protein BJV74DRAFT_864879 [Russula compacta]|nr:hypothetical protein BJV74DRAFT_864879 [Russula compacta]
MADIPFPALPNLLFSARDLVILSLERVPPSGYISPEVMVTCLSGMTGLKILKLHFKFPTPRSRPDRTSPPPIIRAVLPALTFLRFHEVSGYLENLVSGIDSPLLYRVTIVLSDQDIFHTPRLFQFLSRTENLTRFNRVGMAFDNQLVEVTLLDQRYDSMIRLRILCGGIDGQLSFLSYFCSSSLPLFRVVCLNIYEHHAYRQDSGINTTRWLDLLHPFTAVKDLVLYDGLVVYLAPALQDLFGVKVSELLPALQNIFIGGSWRPLPEGILKFVTARQLSGHPVAVLRWGRERGEWVAHTLGGL